MEFDWCCLLVQLKQDLSENMANVADRWQEVIGAQDFPMRVEFAGSVEEASAVLTSGRALVLVLWASSYNDKVQALFRLHQSSIGCLADFEVIICDDPDPKFMAGVFEFGVEQFLASNNWAGELASICRNAVELVRDPSSAESRTVALSRSIRNSDAGAIDRAEKALGELADYDFRAAFAKAKAFEAKGDYTSAADAFAKSSGLNKMFRPSTTSLGESLLITGKVDEALKVFQQLEKTNPYDADRKASIATAYVEKGDFEAAAKYIAAADKLSPRHSRVLEAQAQVFLCTGKINDAFKLLDGMSEVGPFFAAKLNELGIKLSQTGKGKSALALYQKAHKIVRPELRYKISMNAALACRRMGDWDLALKYVNRCQQEFGGPFPKLTKIREAIIAGKASGAPKLSEAS